jgi:hypothetical protein
MRIGINLYKKITKNQNTAEIPFDIVVYSVRIFRFEDLQLVMQLDRKRRLCQCVNPVICEEGLLC